MTEMEHKAVKEMGHCKFSFCSECRQAIEGLINTTSSYCVPVKIFAKSLKVLIIDGL